MKNFTFFLAILISFTLACGNQMDPKSNTLSDNSFGDNISKKGAISYDELLSELNNTDSLSTKVEGTVSEVCQAKGCWMTIVSDNSDKVMRVKFKDYAFFVPKDISGRKVIFEGKAYREQTSVDELRHYAEDAGKSETEIAAITAPQESYKFMASGVLLVD